MKNEIVYEESAVSHVMVTSAACRSNTSVTI